MSKIAVLQMNSGIDPEANAKVLVNAIGRAARGGAAMLFTPEMSGLLDRNRKRAADRVQSEERDSVLAAVRDAAAHHDIWVALGSLAIKGDGDRWVNRSFVINDQGQISARYDKIHMFDVDLATGEKWRESSVYKPGDDVVSVDAAPGHLGMSICYDMRFPALFEALGQRSCDLIAVPAAFTVPTGRAHWHVLLRARAIESSAYIVAAAQTGDHEDGRSTFGHSLVVDPWGEIILDLGTEPNELGFAEISKERIRAVRSQVPSLANRRKIAN